MLNLCTQFSSILFLRYVSILDSGWAGTNAIFQFNVKSQRVNYRFTEISSKYVKLKRNYYPKLYDSVFLF